MDGTVGLLIDVPRDILLVAMRNRWWMGWNLLLAWIPVVLAVGLFRHRGGRSPLWWTGFGLFVLFLPNAPYVVTDLIHLRWMVRWAESDRMVVAAVIPVFVAFIAAGYLAYYLALNELERYLARRDVAPSQIRMVTLGLHCLCTVGVVLGRWARLNSWEPLTRPRNTLEQIATTLTWQRAPAALVLTFAAIVVCYTVTKAVVEGVVLPWGRAAYRWVGGAGA